MYKHSETYNSHKNTVRCISIEKTIGETFISGGDEGELNLWKIGRPNPFQTLSGLSESVTAAKLNRRIAVAGTISGIIKQWDVETGELLGKLTGHSCSVKSMDFHPSNTFFVSLSLDSKIKLWDIRMKKCHSTLTGRALSVIKFSPDGKWIGCGGEGGNLKIFDVSSGKLLYDVITHSDAVTALQFHPAMLVLASADRTPVFTDVDNMHTLELGTMEALHIQSLCWKGEGTQMYSATDNSVKLVSWEPYEIHFADSLEVKRTMDISLFKSDPTKLIVAGCAREAVSTCVIDFKLLAEQTHAHENRTKPKRVKDVKSGDGKDEHVVFKPTRTLNRTPPVSPTRVRHSSPKLESPKERNVNVPDQKEEAVKDVPVVVYSKQVRPSRIPPKNVVPTSNKSDKQENGGGKKIADEIVSQQFKIFNVLKTRASNIQQILSEWTVGKIKTSVESAVNCDDPGIVIDILHVLNQRTDLLSLELFLLLLPVISDLFHKNSRYAVTLCTSLKLLIMRFGELIRDNVNSVSNIGVDLSADERREKCGKCHTELTKIGVYLDGLVASGDNEYQHLYKELQVLLRSVL